MSESGHKFPVSEMFYSPQGEGLYTGTPMWFVRLAGCSVGKKMSEGERNLWGQKFPLFPAYSRIVRPGVGTYHTGGNPQVYTELCHTFDGRPFLCDTDFRTKEVLTAGNILSRVPERCRHICLTGGEPLIHPVRELLNEIHHNDKDVMVHIETSGTIYDKVLFIDLPQTRELWITVSPKMGALPEAICAADEIKLLVDKDFDPEKLPLEIREHDLVYIQPINREHELDEDNLHLCLELLKRFPNWRLSSQAHKIWGVR